MLKSVPLALAGLALLGACATSDIPNERDVACSQTSFLVEAEIFQSRCGNFDRTFVDSGTGRTSKLHAEAIELLGKEHGAAARIVVLRAADSTEGVERTELREQFRALFADERPIGWTPMGARAGYQDTADFVARNGEYEDRCVAAQSYGDEVNGKARGLVVAYACGDETEHSVKLLSQVRTPLQ